jgi:putative phosphoribosyl transferase
MRSLWVQAQAYSSFEGIAAMAHVDSREVRIVPTGLGGKLTLPPKPVGLVLFAHGSGSSRHSPRNVYVAAALHQASIATLLFDLLTETEDFSRENVFDIPLLGRRLLEATQWASSHVPGLPIGYFGASTGAAAALTAAASNHEVQAVVSRGGRPDLAGAALAQVRAPTLLIVGGNDDIVVELNREAYEQLRCEKRLSIVPGATHLFEEPGTLDEVVRLAIYWFNRYLPEKSDSGARSSHVH